jgi:tartrate-resistant acid phosphatase type 5
MPVTRRDFFRTLFAASQTALVGKIMSAPLHAGEPPTGALNFAIIGDWGRRGRPDQVEVAQQMALACQKASASFVVSVGDNFYEDGVASLDDPHWHQSFENVYSAPALQVPWYVILGNHDYHVDPTPQLEYGKTHPRWVMPARYYAQTHRLDAATTADFFYIDTSPMISEYRVAPKTALLPANQILKYVSMEDVPKQLAWLDQSLAASQAPWKIVLGHHPIYSAGSGHGDQQDMIRLVLPILQKHGVQAYFAGHDHDLQHLQADNIQLFVSGGGSEHRPTNPNPHSQFSEGISGFAMASLGANQLQVRFIDNKSNQLHTASVERTI